MKLQEFLDMLHDLPIKSLYNSDVFVRLKDTSEKGYYSTSSVDHDNDGDVIIYVDEK